MGQGFSRMLQSISNEYIGGGNHSLTPLKTSYGGGAFKEVESTNSGRSTHKRPSSSDRSKVVLFIM